MDPRPLLVRRTTWESDGVLSLVLEDPVGVALPAWEPGSHIDLEIGEGIIRQYSLCGDLADKYSWRVGVLRELRGRGGSEAVHTTLRPGMTVQVLGLRSNFPLMAAPSYLFIAGGIGITPILPMVQEIVHRSSTWSMLYCGRRRDSMAFLGELAGHGEKVSVVPEDEAGRPELKQVIGAVDLDTALYCCGPGPLIDAVIGVCQDLGRPAPHVERFAANKTPAPEPANEGNRSFEVVLSGSDRTVQVSPQQTILDALEQAGESPLFSCREGFCGTCEVGVVSGEIDHRDEYLTDRSRSKGRSIMICVSRAANDRLVLDL